MDTEALLLLRAQATDELAKLDDEFKALNQRRETLRQFMATATQLLGTPARRDAVVSLSTIQAKPTMPAVAVATLNESTTARATRVLQARSPSFITPRELLEALEADGWVTASDNPIHVIRNTMSSLAARIPQIKRRSNADGTSGYAWIESKDVTADLIAPHEEGG